MTTYTKRINNADTTREIVSYGSRDSKGREIGSSVTRWTCQFVAQDADKPWGFANPAGSYFVAVVMATRDGSDYGASQRTMYFTTNQAREAFIAKRLAASRKATAKKQEA